MRRNWRITRGRLAGPFFLCLAVTAQAQSSNAARPQQKCARYTAAWEKTIAARGTAGISAEFLEKHAAFIAGGCIGAHDVCPRSQAEFDLANVLFIQSMNAGMASTFAPFGCPK